MDDAPARARARAFPRSRRITDGRIFQRLKREGGRLAHGCLVLNWQRRTDATESRLGVITSRQVGGAVVRTRARRLLREAFRLHQHELLQPQDLVLVARPSVANKSFHEVEADFLQALRRARLMAREA